jgi:invasion protein IalB
MIGRFTNISRALVLGMFAAAWSFSPAAAQAQQGSLVTDSQTMGSWSVRCYRQGPLGVSFDQGLTLQIGTFNAQNIKFRVCGRDGCLVVTPLPPQLIEAMSSAGSARGTMKAAYIDGRQFQIPILLDGFSDGLDSLKKKTAEKLASAAKK